MARATRKTVAGASAVVVGGNVFIAVKVTFILGGSLGCFAGPAGCAAGLAIGDRVGTGVGMFAAAQIGRGVYRRLD